MMSEGTDSIRMLGNKLVDLKKYRDSLQGEAARRSAEITQLEAELHRLQAELDSRVQQQEERNEKLRRVNLIIQETETALKKIADNAAKLDQVMDRELSSFKKSY